MSRRISDSQLRSFFPTLVFIGIFILLVALLLPQPLLPPQTLAAQTATAANALQPTTVVLLPTTLSPAAPGVVYDTAAIAEGQGILSSACSACHGLDARGITGLGKNLIESEFVHNLTDEELLQFIIMGRDTSDLMNTTGLPMPPRGGNPSLTDDQLRSVIAFLRTESGSASVQQAAPTVVAVAPTEMPVPRLEATVLPTTIPVTPQPFSAQAAYAWSCAGCHGMDGRGNAPFGSEFVSSPLLEDREALLSFIVSAHPPVGPQVEFPHPARGGYPALSDEQLDALIDYVIQLHAD